MTAGATVSITVPQSGGIDVVVRDNLEDPTPGTVRLELHQAGICGTDLAVIAGTTALAEYPLRLGHEFVGRVVAAPTRADVMAGDWAIVFPTISCGKCRACLAGRENQCDAMRVLGISDPNGCFTNVLDIAPEQAIKLPTDVAISHGCLVEPLAVACHVLSRADLQPDDVVLIIGAGVIGLSCAAAARARGAGRIVLVDRMDRKKLAATLGFTDVHQISAPEELGELVPPESIDVVLDVVTSPATVAQAVPLVRRGGRIVGVATPKASHRLELDYNQTYERELAFIAARNYTRADFRAAISLLADERVDLRPLVTGRFPLAEAVAAFTELRDRPEAHLKVLLVPEIADAL